MKVALVLLAVLSWAAPAFAEYRTVALAVRGMD